MMKETVLARLMKWLLSPLMVKTSYVAHRSEDGVIDINRPKDSGGEE
jgi:hypothetical protein